MRAGRMVDASCRLPLGWGVLGCWLGAGGVGMLTRDGPCAVALALPVTCELCRVSIRS